jgi:hypothetical protein
MTSTAILNRTKDNPWQLRTAPGTSEYTVHLDPKVGAPVLVCTVGKTVLLYDARCVDDLYAMLKVAGDWVELGGADEQKPAKEGTVEAWGRSEANPVGGWYASRKGSRAFRSLPAAPDGRAGALRARAQREEQPHAREIDRERNIDGRSSARQDLRIKPYLPVPEPRRPYP